MPEVERPEFRKDAKPTERSYGKNVVRSEGIVRKRRSRWVLWVLLKNYGFTTGHHFDEC